MKITDILKFIVAVLLMGATIALAAFDPVNDDTDIFLANPNVTAQRPNVLIILDNTANWNNAFTNEKNALVQVVNGLTNAFNVGLMLFPETGNPNDNVDGGYVRYHVRRMGTTNKSALASLVGNLDILGDKGNNATTGLALYEAYLYYAGLASVASFGKVKTDTDGTTDPLLIPLATHALPASPNASSLYRSPIADGCARNFIIYISNGPANENASARAYLQDKLATLTGVNPPAQISITPNGQQGNWADEMAKYMANADVFATNAGVPNSSGVQNVYTYTVEVDPGTTGGGPDMTALLQSVATNGKGKYFAVSSSASGTAIVDALNQIFTEVQAVNSVFASTTLPVSVNVRGTNLNQVYIGVFRPDANKAPAWLGNLKMYNLALNAVTNTVFLADAANSPPPHASPPPLGNPAENATTGFISQSSPSFWTSDSTFWGYRNPSQNGAGGPSDRPDGDLVEKGGAAQQLRIAYAAAEATLTPRNLYTCTTGVVGVTAQDCQPNTGFALSNTPFSTANTAISPGTLQLANHPVTPLTAYTSQTAASISDRLPITYITNTWASGYQIANIATAGVSATITSLTTAVPKAITSLTGVVQGTITVNITSIAKSGASYVITTASPFTGVVDGTTVLPAIACSNNTTFNSLTAANRTVSAHTTSAPFTYTIPGPSGNQSCSGGTVNGPGPVNSGVITVTMPSAHGFTSGQSITIQNATPSQLNGTFGITCSPAPGCAGATTFTYNLLSGQTAGAGSGGTASGNTTTATATTSAAHTFANGSSVTISGASNAAYNGTFTITCSPAPLCTGATTFTYTVASAVGPDTNSSLTPSGVHAFQGGGNTATVTTFGSNGFQHGQTIYISGSDVPGYNGAFTISCAPFTAGTTCSSGTTFTITTAGPQPANTSYLAFASTTFDTTVLALAPNNSFSDGEFGVIEGPAPVSATAKQLNTFGGWKSYFSFVDPTITGPITATGYKVRSRDNPRAYVTLPNHGYSDSQQVRISGANPSGYNGEPLTISVCTPTTPASSDFPCDPFGPGSTNPIFQSYKNMFSYPLSALQGANTGIPVTVSVKTTTAHATSVNHGFTNGSTVSIAGASPNDFNGNVVITVVDANNFTYTIPTGVPQGDATGTILGGQAFGSSPERDLIIRWVRGEDNFSDENTNASTTDIRASVHGDVLHSRPAVVNYNRYAGSDDDVFVFYGANDGVFHAIKGGYRKPAADPSTLQPGQEAWGFVPKEFFPNFRRMRNDSPIISSSFKRPYFMDGPIGIYTNDANGNGKLGDTGDTVNLYIANRRGGRFMYALDVNDPTNPKFLWKIDTSTTGFGGLGQSWSQPLVVTGLAGLSIPVLVFGAGYDSAVDDIDPTTVTSVNATTGDVTTASGTTARSMGRGIYVVNALTGALLWNASYPTNPNNTTGVTASVPGMVYSIPSDVTVVRNESGGAVNRAYVGDTGGNMWRVDFKQDTSAAALAANANNLSLTTVTKLASIADQTTAAGRRKFLFPPDVVAQTGFDAILVGSGDREHPFDTTVTNRFYMFKDKGTDLGAITGTTTCDPTILEASIPDPTNACAPVADPTATPPVSGDIPGLSDLTSDCLQDASACLAGETQAAVKTKLGTDRGWFITLQAGEKVVGNAVSIGGTTFFNTNQPSATAGGGTCGSNLGVARQYQVASADATSTSDLNAVGGLTGADRSLIHAGGGYLPSPVHVVVMLGGKPVEAVISGIQVSTPAGATLSARLRKYWYRDIDPR